MTVNMFFLCFMVLPCLIMGQIPFQHPGQYGPPVNGDLFQQQQHQMQQQQIPIHQQQQQQQQQMFQQQQPPIHQQQQQQQPQMNSQQQQQQQPQMNSQQQPQLNPQQQQPQINPQQQQPQLNAQQQYYQGNMGGGPPIQSGQPLQPLQPIQPPPLSNQFQQPTNDNPAALPPSVATGPTERYLVGNLSEPFTFNIAPPSVQVSHLGLNGYSLYIKGMGFQDKSRFNYDEQNNRLTVLSLDPTTVGYYTAVDTNWNRYMNILSAVNVSSLEISNFQTNDDNNGSSPVFCSVSIIRSTFKLADPPTGASNNLGLLPQSSIPSTSRSSSTLAGTENLPRLDLFLSTRTQSSTLPNNKIYNDTLNGQLFTRTIAVQRPLTRADHNGTIQCQVESNNNIDVFVIKTVPINVQYGPNLETGALPTVTLDSEALKVISLDCQIEANPAPSYVWYEILTNTSSNMMPYYGNQNPYGQQQQYPLMPPSNVPTAGLSVFGTTRQIQRIYQNPGPHAMQCQAQSRGKTVKQEFIITVHPSVGGSKTGLDGSRAKSYKTPMIIGISIGGVLLLLVILIIIAAIIFLKRRKTTPNEKRSTSIEKLSNTKQGRDRWGHSSNVPSDYPKYKHEILKGDSTSTSHLVESAESSTSQPPPVPNRPSPIASTNSSYRQPPVSVSLSYRQASALPGFRPPPPPTRSYSPDNDDDVDSNINPVPLPTNRSRTTTPFGSRKSLSESIQSLRSNQQSGLSLPVKKRSNEQPPPPPIPAPVLPKRDQRTPSPKSFDAKKEYQHHHYHNPAQLRAQQNRTNNNNDQSSDDEESEIQQRQRATNANEDTAGAGPGVSSKTSTNYNQNEHQQQQQQQQQHVRRLITPPPPQKIAVHQPSGVRHDEVPPSYQQVANSSSSANTYAYQEPTEV